MRRNCCHVSLGFVLKLLNYLQAFVGVSILLYSVWMLNQWNDRAPVFPPPAYPPGSSPAPLSSARSAEMARSDRSSGLEIAARAVSRFDDGLGLALGSFELPAPWYVLSLPYRIASGLTFPVELARRLHVVVIGLIVMIRHGISIGWFALQVSVRVMMLSVFLLWQVHLFIYGIGHCHVLHLFNWLHCCGSIKWMLPLLCILHMEGLLHVKLTNGDNSLFDFCQCPGLK